MSDEMRDRQKVNMVELASRLCGMSSVAAEKPSEALKALIAETDRVLFPGGHNTPTPLVDKAKELGRGAK